MKRELYIAWGVILSTSNPKTAGNTLFDLKPVYGSKCITRDIYIAYYTSKSGIWLVVPRHVICNLRDWSKSVGYGRITHTI